jgi:Tfp pilus assembly protein PilF
VLASAGTGRELDAVEADRWWGSEAVSTRLADPAGTVSLIVRKVLLLAGSPELSLDYAPAIDDNPWRHAAPMPFALLFALSAAGAMLRGFRKSGGGDVWGAIVAAALTPVLFYFSSRYRLPVAALLCIPAACGAVALVEDWRRGPTRRTMIATGAAVVLLATSLVVSPRPLVREARATSLANRAVAWKQAGNLPRAEDDLRRALAIEADSVPAHYNLGVVLEAGGRADEAESAYRSALQLDPGHVESAGNLAGILVRAGRAEEALAPLRRALSSRPDHRACWTNLVVALVSIGRADEARLATEEARGNGVTLAPGLLEAIQRETGGRSSEER